MKPEILFDKIYSLTTNGFGSWFTSKEPKLQVGTVRCIRGVLFQVTYQHGSRWNRYTTWTPADPKLNTMPNMRAFAEQVCRGEDEVYGLSAERQ